MIQLNQYPFCRKVMLAPTLIHLIAHGYLLSQTQQVASWAVVSYDH